MDDSMKDPPITKFKTVAEECAYWKNRCSEIKQKFIKKRQEFTDLDENSRKVQAELKATLHQREKQIRDLKNSNESLLKKITTSTSAVLQHFSTHLSLVERAQSEAEKLATLELETTKVKTEPQEGEEPIANETDTTVVKAAAAQEDSDDSTSTVSHISARSLEELEEPPCGLNTRSLNLSRDENEPTSGLSRRSRSKKRSLTKEKDTRSKSEVGKRKREKSRSEESPNKAKKARPVTLKRVANSSPNRMQYEITNSPHNTERANRGKKAPKEPIASTSTPLRAKNDQSSITTFFKKANTCESCGTFSKDPSYLKFHEDFHSTRQCPGCSIKFAGEKYFDVTKHIACFLLKSKLSKAELIRMNGMQVTVSRLHHEQIRKEEPNCCKEKLPAKQKAKDRKRKAFTPRVKSKEAKVNRKDRGQKSKSSSHVDIDAPRDERKRSKSKSTTESKGTMDDTMENEDIGEVSIPLNWNAETAKDKVFWIRSFGSNDPIYIPIRPKKVNTNSKLTKTIQKIDEFAKRASETTLNLSAAPTPRTAQLKASVSVQDQSSPRAVPRNRSASVFIQLAGAHTHEIVRTDQSPANRLSHGQEQPSRVPPNPVSIIQNNNGIVTCITKSVLLNTSNPSDMANNMIVPKQAGLINARRKSVATEMTRIAMNKNFYQANSLAAARRSSISLERPNVPNTPGLMHAYYHRNTSVAVPNTSAISLRSINSDHSYNGPNPPDRVTANQPQTNQPQTNQSQLRQIIPSVTYTLQSITPSQSSPQQPQLMTSIARDAFSPSPFPVNTLTVGLVASAANNPVSTITQTQQPKKTQLKVLTVADLNAKVPKGNLSPMSQPIPELDHSNTSNAQLNHSSGFQGSKPRMKLTPFRPPQVPVTINEIPDTEAISVSLTKIQDEQIELTLNIRGQRIEYESLNDRQKTDVKQCLLRNNIWKEMLGHIKKGKPTQETLNLFKRILPMKERQEFFDTLYRR